MECRVGDWVWSKHHGETGQVVAVEELWGLRTLRLWLPTSNAKQLKVFRVEAMRAGFKAAYDRMDYRMIVDVAEKLPETVLQEDEKLLMYYDVASMRLGDRKDKAELF